MFCCFLRTLCSFFTCYFLINLSIQHLSWFWLILLSVVTQSNFRHIILTSSFSSLCSQCIPNFSFIFAFLKENNILTRKMSNIEKKVDGLFPVCCHLHTFVQRRGDPTKKWPYLLFWDVSNYWAIRGDE